METIKMEAIKDQEGFLSKVRGRFGFRKDIALSKWNDNVYVHISDNYNCWENDTFDKTKSKCVTMKWKDAKKLRDYIDKLESYATQIETEIQVGLTYEQQQTAFDEPFDAQTAGPSQAIYNQNLVPVNTQLPVQTQAARGGQYLSSSYQQGSPPSAEKNIYQRQGNRYQPY